MADHYAIAIFDQVPQCCHYLAIVSFLFCLTAQWNIQSVLNLLNSGWILSSTSTLCRFPRKRDLRHTSDTVAYFFPKWDFGDERSTRHIYMYSVCHLRSKYINNILHLARKYARIFVRGHYLFREAKSFRERSPWKTMSFEEQIVFKAKYPSLFLTSGGNCVL